MPIDTYLADILRPLLTRPDAAQIALSNDDMGILLTIIVAKEDMGSIIGKSGETAKCIRHLIRIAGIKQNARVSVKINEPDGRPYVPKRPDKANDRDLVANEK